MTDSKDPTTSGLPAALREGIEASSGGDMRDVRIHRDSARPADLGVAAAAQGSDIHLAPGQDAHSPREAWHVVQQKQGRIRPTVPLKGAPTDNDDALEREADAMGAKAAPDPQAGRP